MQRNKEKQNGKDRDFFKKIGDIKNISCKYGDGKDRNCKSITELEEIKKWWQEHTDLYKKNLKDPDNQDGVVLTKSQISWSVKSYEI